MTLQSGRNRVSRAVSVRCATAGGAAVRSRGARSFSSDIRWKHCDCGGIRRGRMFQRSHRAAIVVVPDKPTGAHLVGIGRDDTAARTDDHAADREH
jgi:hypothetical protein